MPAYIIARVEVADNPYTKGPPERALCDKIQTKRNRVKTIFLRSSRRF
jgi:hypothetical protein